MLKKILLSVVIILSGSNIDCSAYSFLRNMLDSMHSGADTYHTLATKKDHLQTNSLFKIARYIHTYANTLLVYISTPFYCTFLNLAANKEIGSAQGQDFGKMMHQSFILPVAGVFVLFLGSYYIAKKIIHLIQS